MGLLEKVNPSATRKSVLWWALGGGITAPVWVLFLLRGSPIHRPSWPLILVAAAVVGAGMSALVEWQYDDGSEEDKATAPPPAGVWDRELDHGYPSAGRDT